MIGSAEIVVVSADVSGLLSRLSEAGVSLSDLRIENEIKISFHAAVLDIQQVKKICLKHGDEIRIQNRRGMFFIIRSLLQRKVLLIGLLFIFAAIIYLPTRVLFIEVNGNEKISAGQILETAELCGIRFGADRQRVRSERMKNALLEEMPQLQWAGINTNGCRAIISVRERTDQSGSKEANDVQNIVAVTDGVVTSCTASSGNLLCSPGEAVTEGEILISAYTDCGITIRAECAEGEVYADTVRELSIVTPLIVRTKREEKACKHIYSILVGKNRYIFWKDSGISGDTCDRIYEEYYATLPGEFCLPIAFCVDSYVICEYEQSENNIQEKQIALAESSRRYLLNRMSAGRVQSFNEEFVSTDELLRLDAQYYCNEMIGIARTDEIGDRYGKGH